MANGSKIVGQLPKTMSSFRAKGYGNTSTGIPLTGGVECRGGGMKNRDFRPISSFVSEMIQGTANYYRMQTGNLPKLSSDTFSVAFSDL